MTISSLTMDWYEPPFRCANCGRGPLPEESPKDDWSVFAQASGAPYVFCPECAKREFAPEAPASGRLPHSLPRRDDPGLRER